MEEEIKYPKKASDLLKEKKMLDSECKYQTKDKDGTAYCKASEMNGPLDCKDADYHAKSFYPTCNKDNGKV